MRQFVRGAVDLGAIPDANRARQAADGRCGGLDARRRHRPNALKATIVVADVVTVVTAMVLAFGFSTLLREAHVLADPRSHLILGAASLPLWVVIFFHYRLYSANHVASRRDELGRLVHAVGASVVGMATLGFMTRLNVARGWLGFVFATTTVSLAAEREVVRRVLGRRRRDGRLVRRIVIIGGNADGVALCANLMERPDLGYEVVGFIADGMDGTDVGAGRPLLGPIADARRVVKLSGARGVMLVASALDTKLSSRLARELAQDGIRIEVLPSLVGVAAGRLNVRSVGRFPIVDLGPVNHHGWRSVAKRGFDVLLAGFTLLVASPLLALIAVAIVLDSGGPVLFRQDRIGVRGTPFQLLKFRSMVVDAEDRLGQLAGFNEAPGPLFKMRGDPRVTRVGRLLRRLSLDELPQCWNVLRGEMAMVGPRPALAAEVTGWSPELHERLKVKPGITGLWQVGGRSQASFEDYTHLDLYYIDNWSLLTDLSIIAQTIPAVLSRKGAY